MDIPCPLDCRLIPFENRRQRPPPKEYQLRRSCRLEIRQTMSDVENKPTDKTETKPAGKPEIKPVAKEETKPAGTPASKAENQEVTAAETKPADKRETKPVGKTENRQAGKGSKRRPFNAKQFSANYESIRWGKGQSQRPKH